MLPTQVQYWANQEQARHNRAMESVQYGELQVAQNNAISNARNAYTNMVNAQTNARNAETNAYKAAIDERVAAQNYEVGILQAGAAAQQAKAALSQAATAQSRSEYDNVYTAAKTEYQSKENAWYTVDKVTEVAEQGTRALRNIGLSFDSLLSGARGVIQNLSYHLRN